MSVTHAHVRAHDHPADAVAARVGARVVTVAEVHARERALRDGPFAARLPLARTPQGRNVRRWIVQLLATEELVLAEARRRRLTAHGTAFALDVHSAVALGGVVATVLATLPVAPAVRDAVTAHLRVPDAEVRAHHARNLDQFTVPESRTLDELVDGRSVPWGRVVAGELPASWETAVFAAGIGQRVSVGTGRVLVVREVTPAAVRPFETVREALQETLGRHRRDLAFGAWLQERYAAEVVLEQGFEHPGDPEQADATHRH